MTHHHPAFKRHLRLCPNLSGTFALAVTTTLTFPFTSNLTLYITLTPMYTLIYYLSIIRAVTIAHTTTFALARSALGLLEPVNKLVSLTWLMWALRNFPRLTLH